MTMTTLYKITDTAGWTDMGTRHARFWEAGVCFGTMQENGSYGDAIWAYLHPVVAVLMEPVYERYGPSARLWEARGSVSEGDYTRAGCHKLKIDAEMELPAITGINRAAFAILCAKNAHKDKRFLAWADAWLSGEDRSEEATHAATEKAREILAERSAFAAYPRQRKHNMDFPMFPPKPKRSWIAAEAAEDAAKAARQAVTDGDPSFLAAWAAKNACKVVPLNLPSIARQAMEIN